MIILDFTFSKAGKNISKHSKKKIDGFKSNNIIIFGQNVFLLQVFQMGKWSRPSHHIEEYHDHHSDDFQK